MSRHGKHRVVVITGASSGIGRGAALAFAARGDHIVLAARSTQGLDRVAAKCRELDGPAAVVDLPSDVRARRSRHQTP